MLLRAFVWGIVNIFSKKIFWFAAKGVWETEIKLNMSLFGRTSQSLNKAYLQQVSLRGSTILQRFLSLIDSGPSFVHVPS